MGQRIAVGPEGSGTRALATQLMHAVRTDAAPTRLLPLGGSAAADVALEKGDADAAFIVGSPDAPVVQRLLRTRGVRLMSIVNADAFARHFPFLSTVRLPRGVIDLAADVPDAEVTMLATTASILMREDFHPALAFLLIYAAAEVHGKPGLLHRQGEFPTAREADFPLSEEASRYFKSGPPFLQRYLPFWLANLIKRMLVLLVPIFAVVVPALKILPAVFQWRVKSRVFRWYGELKPSNRKWRPRPMPRAPTNSWIGSTPSSAASTARRCRPVMPTTPTTCARASTWSAGTSSESARTSRSNPKPQALLRRLRPDPAVRPASRSEGYVPRERRRRNRPKECDRIGFHPRAAHRGQAREDLASIPFA